MNRADRGIAIFVCIVVALQSALVAYAMSRETTVVIKDAEECRQVNRGVWKC